MGIFLNFVLCTIVATLSLLIVSWVVAKLRETSDGYQPEFKVGDKVVGLNDHIWYVQSVYKNADGIYEYGVAPYKHDDFIHWHLTEDQLELYVD
jgi:hypothetical protein